MSMSRTASHTRSPLALCAGLLLALAFSGAGHAAATGGTGTTSSGSSGTGGISSGPGTSAIPAASPATLNFPATHENEQVTLTVSIVASAAGTVTGAAQGADFSIAAIRGITAQRGVGGLGLQYVNTIKTTAPFQLSVPAGSTVYFDVVFAPKPSSATVRGGALSITGQSPAAGQAWTQTVGLWGNFVQSVKLGLPGTLSAIEPDFSDSSTIDVPIQVTGTDHTVWGTFVLQNAPNNVQIAAGTVTSMNIGAYTNSTIHVPIAFNHCWQGSQSICGGGAMRIAFVYGNTYGNITATADSVVLTYPNHKAIGFSTGSFNDVSLVDPSALVRCDRQQMTGVVTFRATGRIDLLFAWDVDAFPRDAGTSTLLRAYADGHLLAEGIYPNDVPSAEYIQGYTPAVNYQTFYVGSQFLQTINAKSFVFSCDQIQTGSLQF
jgi:hypothetical protein